MPNIKRYKNQKNNLPFSFFHLFLFGRLGTFATEGDADAHQHAAAVDEVAGHVDNDEEDEEHPDHDGNNCGVSHAFLAASRFGIRSWETI